MSAGPAHAWNCACGTRNATTLPACWRCGRSRANAYQAIAPSAAPPHPHGPAGPPQRLPLAPRGRPAQAAFCCAACGNPQVQKVSAICQASNWSSASAGGFVGVGDVGGQAFATVGTTASLSAGTTQLAQMLAPPPPPGVCRPDSAPALLCGFGTVLFGLMGLVLLGTYWMTGVVLLGLAALCCVGLWISMAKAKSILRQGEIRYLQEEARWRQALARWDELFYCSRCDSVSNPRTSQSARAGAMYSLLY